LIDLDSYSDALAQCERLGFQRAAFQEMLEVYSDLNVIAVEQERNRIMFVS
jgi:hypothetical protein